MKTLNSFIGIIILILILKFALPPEAVTLASEILIKILSVIHDLLAQISVPQ